VGAQRGDGALRKGGKTVGYYNMSAASYGLQAGVLSTTTAKDDVYPFIFGQKGLMAGLGLQGSKLTQINL
jgi:lipid-binding SYLF domain-containing protein